MKKWVLEYEIYDTSRNIAFEASTTEAAKAEAVQIMRGWGARSLRDIGIVQVREAVPYFTINGHEVADQLDLEEEQARSNDEEQKERAELKRLLEKYGAMKD